MAKADKKAKPLTKAQLIAHVAESSGLPKKQIGELFEEILKVAYREAKKEGGFVFPGLGKMVVTQSKARTGIHPKTKQPIKIPAKRRLKFRVAKAAKDAILGAKK